MINLFKKKNLNFVKNSNLGYMIYQGAKRKISFELIEAMHKVKPNATTFIDLFGGGASMSIRALDIGYNVIYNELQQDVFHLVEFILTQARDKSKQSKYGILPEEFYNFVSREEFFKLKNTQNKTIKDIFNLMCYSFGSRYNGNYLFNREREQLKKESHNLILLNQPSNILRERFKFMENIVIELENIKCNTWKEKRLIFVNIILKLEAIRVSLLYNDSVLKEFQHLDLQGLRQTTNTLIIDSIQRNLIDKGYNVPLKAYKNSKPRKLRELQQLQHLQQLQQIEHIARIEQIERLQHLQQLQHLQHLQQIEQIEQIERIERLQHLQQIEQIEQIERIERLQHLQQIDKFIFSNQSYENVDLSQFNNDDVIIYCDPPYRNTEGYNIDFDFNKFDNWLIEMRKKGFDVFISEYTQPPQTTEIFNIKKEKLLATATNKKTVLERLFINR